jgi:hypothetical protein
MRRILIICLFFFEATVFLYGQTKADGYQLRDIFVSCEGDISLFMQTGIIVYVSNEDGRPDCFGNFFTIKNASNSEISYTSNHVQHYKNARDSNSFIIMTSANSAPLYYPVVPGAKQTNEVFDYRSKKDGKTKVFLSLTLKIAAKNDSSADLNVWNKIFANNDKLPNDSQNSAGDQEDDKIFYKGPNSDLIALLLTKVKGWRTPKSLTINDGIPPKINQECVRDNYVAAALNFAWAAESYFRLNSDKSAQMALKAAEQIQRALALCSDKPTVGTDNSKCVTEDIISCDQKVNYLLPNGTQLDLVASGTQKLENNKVYYSASNPEAPVKPKNYFPYSLLDSNLINNSADNTLADLGGVAKGIANPNLLDYNFFDKVEKRRLSKAITAFTERNAECKQKYKIDILKFTQAIRNDDTLVVKAALDNDFPINEYLDQWESTVINTQGYFTGMHIAAIYGSINCMKIFLDHNADINVSVRKVIMQMGGTDAFRVFLPEATPRHVAVFYNQIRVVKILLDHGASKTIKAMCNQDLYKNGEDYKSKKITALELAMKLKRTTIINLLK